MSQNKRIRESGETLLKAYVALKAGDVRKGAKLFASLRKEESVDTIMDGIAKAMMRLKAEELEEELDEDIGDDLEEDIMDDLEEDGPEDDVDELEIEEDETIEVPASVAKYLKLK